jgi:hypothetical protein
MHTQMAEREKNVVRSVDDDDGGEEEEEVVRNWKKNLTALT